MVELRTKGRKVAISLTYPRFSRRHTTKLYILTFRTTIAAIYPTILLLPLACPKVANMGRVIRQVSKRYIYRLHRMADFTAQKPKEGPWLYLHGTHPVRSSIVSFGICANLNTNSTRKGAAKFRSFDYVCCSSLEC
jgi:hypothetical protein